MRNIINGISIKKTLSFLLVLMLISGIGTIPAIAAENEETEYRIGESLCNRCESEICECTGEDSAIATYEIAAAWNPTMPLPPRKLTVSELNAWIAQYDQAGISAVELEILRLTNIEREKAGVHPLGIHPDLFRAARFKSQEMMNLGYFDHYSPVYGGPTPLSQLFTGAAYGVGENIVWGYPSLTAAKAVQLWMDSPGHRANILNPSYQSIGIGFVGSYSTGSYAGQMFSLYPPPYEGEVTRFVERLYIEVLGRTYDEGGLHFWSNQLKSGRATGASVAHGFFFSPEFKNRPNIDNDRYLSIIYLTLMDRAPDAGGSAYWGDRLRAGLPREDVFAGFVHSPEFTKLCGSYGIVRGDYTPPRGGMARVFATRLYRTTLQREPDLGGLNFWHNALANGSRTGASAASGFIFSPEMNNRNLKNEEFIEILYNALMGRNSDAGGKSFWVNQLRNGSTRYSVFAGFVYSSEFEQICRDHGIIRGAA